VKEKYTEEIMDVKEYNALPLGEKAIILWDRGKLFQVWQQDEKYKIGIYLLDNSIVAVTYNLKTGDISTIAMWGAVVNKQQVLESAAA
jgi:hypothetical protein